MRRLKHTNPMREMLLAVRAGRMSFTEFALATEGDWRRLAHWTVNRWDVPEAVEHLDIEQEMLIGAWLAVSDWNDDGMEIDTFVKWRANAVANRWINRQRGSLRLSPKAPSRYPISFAVLGTDAPMDDRSSMATQDEDVAILRLLGAAIDTLNAPDAACVLALLEAGGNVVQAAKTVNANTRLKLRLRIGNEEGARRAICRALEQVAATAT